MSEEEDDYILTDDEYSTACTLAQTGNTKQLKQFLSSTLKGKKVGPQTLAADPTALYHVVRRLSPLTYAARNGQTDTVKFFLQRYRKIININPGAQEYHNNPLLSRKEKRHDHPLYWASLSGHLDVVKLLVSSKAIVNLPNCMLASPLHGASLNGHLDVVEYLVHKNANINARDVFKATPLIVAAQYGHGHVVDYLILEGADTTQVTSEGYSVMHVAALNGHHHVVQLLLEYGLSPMFSEAPTDSEAKGVLHVPCPVFLAATYGHFKVVNILLRENNCPPSVESDALMLTGVGLHDALRRMPFAPHLIELPGIPPRQKISSREDSARGIIEACWLRGIRLREEHSLKTNLPKMEAYGNQSEINSSVEVASINQDITKNVYQSLIILERCLGAGHHLIMQLCFGMADSHLIDMRLFACVQRILHKAIESWRREINRGFYRDPYSFQLILDNFLHKLVPWSRGVTFYNESVASKGSIRYMRIALAMLDILVELHTHYKCEGDSLQSILSAILYFFASWLQCDYQNSLYKRLTTVDMYIGSDECEELGKRFVTSHLHSLEGTTLLHMALNDTRLVQASLSSRYMWHAGCSNKEVDLGLLVNALLRWGADAAIDVFDWNGQRPLHLAVNLTDSTYPDQLSSHKVISPLLKYGAHLDYINKKGKTPVDLCKSPKTKELLAPNAPLPLSCLICAKIIKENLPYNEDPNVPSRIRKLIRNHGGKN